MAPENAHSNNVQAIVDEEKLHKAEFLNLWNRINHKSFYTVQFDTPELIDHSIRALDSKLNVTRVQINLEYGEQTARLESREQLEQGKASRKPAATASPPSMRRLAACGTTLSASWWRKPV